MKKLTLNLMIILFTLSGLMNNVLAQAPEGIIYQAEARDSKGLPIRNQALDIKIRIVQEDGFVVYEELHKINTNNEGMFVLTIGQGTNTQGLLENVDWGNHSHFLNVQVKEAKKNVWINMGTSQLLSVPYALHAKTAENLSDGEKDPVFTLWDKSTGISITENQISNLGNYIETETDPVFTAWDKNFEDLTNKPTIDGSETIVISGANVTVTGAGTTASPYVVNATGQTPGTAAGQMLYWNGTAWVNVALGATGQVLTLINGVPTWKTTVGVGDVANPTTGKIWMDRNLGATKVATSSVDATSYGYLYQWGRLSDGHQTRTSGTTSTLSNSDTPVHGNFILAPSSPYDWRSPQNVNLWQGVSSINNPCPSGYRLPTEAEWNTERLSWSTNNAAGAFASLKLPLAGNRDGRNGSLGYAGSYGGYWSSSVSGAYSRALSFDSSIALMDAGGRSLALSVRCIKD